MKDYPNYRSTGSAYDDCQTNPEMKAGTIFTVESEKVVGIAWAWPIAITATEGQLHGIKTDPRTWGKLAPRGGMPEPEIAAATGEAIALAKAKGWELSPALRDNV